MPSYLVRNAYLRLLTVLAAIVATASVITMHAVADRRLDPVSAPLSDYGLSSRSALLFAISCLALAAGSIAFGNTLAGHRRWAAYAAAAMLVLVVLFPTDPPHAEALSPAAHIHRYAAGAAFVLLGVAIAGMVSDCSGWLRTVLTAVCITSALMLVLTVVAAFWPDLLAIWQWRGIPQRVLLLGYVAALTAIGVHPGPVAGRAIDSGVRNIRVNAAG